MTTNLLNTQQTTILISYSLLGVAVPAPSAVIAVSVDQPSFLTATLLPDNATIDVVTADGAVGTANVTVSATLADGTVLTSVETFVIAAPVAADPDAIVLTIGPIVSK